MSTNFYLIYNELVDTECPCCGHIVQEKRKRHLGKSSGGWCYSLHVYPEEGLDTFDDMKNHVEDVCSDGGRIEDEYGNILTHTEEWVDIVTIRKGKYSPEEIVKINNTLTGTAYRDSQHFLDKNHAIIGSNNLLRHKIDGRYCIGHGSGTWDYLVGDFS